MISRSLLKLIEEIGNPASIIDQTLLRPEAGAKKYERFVEESERYGFRSLVVPLNKVSLVTGITKKPVTTVIAFPHGNTEVEIKLKEIEIASSRGAREVDVVLDIGSIVEGLWDKVEAEIKAISARTKELGLVSKVIIETGYLTKEQIERVSRIAANYEIDYVKTSTGFGPRGASVDDVILIKQNIVGKKTGVKAAGGIRTIWDLTVLVAAGADIIGSSSGVEIVNQYEAILKHKSNI